MKRPLLLLFFFPLFSQAQIIADSTQPDTYLFEHFVEGSVLQKNGNTQRADLNYDARNGSIIFKQNGQNLVLTGLENVDTVYIGDKKFVAAEDRFYQVGTYTPIALFISYTYKTHPKEATTEHSGTSQQNSNMVSNNVSNAYLSRRFQGHFAVEFIKQFWLRRGRSFYKANNENQVAKIFPQKKDAIGEYVRKNKIEFGREKDMISLINFCND